MDTDGVFDEGDPAVSDKLTPRVVVFASVRGYTLGNVPELVLEMGEDDVVPQMLLPVIIIIIIIIIIITFETRIVIPVSRKGTEKSITDSLKNREII